MAVRYLSVSRRYTNDFCRLTSSASTRTQKIEPRRHPFTSIEWVPVENFLLNIFFCVLRSFLGFFSTAAEQRSAGDDCHGDDGDDDHSHLVTHSRTLETRARKLEQQVDDLTERYKRAMADSDNVRRRTQKFVEDAKLFGIQSFCRDIVEVADLLEKSSVVEERDGAQQLSQCLAHIKGRLQEVFTKHGLEKMSPIGGQYDPYQHEIVCHSPAEGAEPGTVALVKQDGYILHGRTIRHALVGIAVKTQEQ